MIKKTQLAKVAVGSNFMVWGHAYTVLDRNEKHVLALAANVVCEMMFRESFRVNHYAQNDFRGSAVRDYLTRTYGGELMRNGANANRDFYKIPVDLKCTAGGHEYGVGDTYIGLLTLEQYGKYHDIIPKVEQAYWLATPTRTPRYAHATQCCSVWHVNLNGDYEVWYCGNKCGVRPLLALNPGLEVFAETEEEEDWGKTKMLDYVRQINQVDDEDFAVLARRDFEVRKCLCELQRILEADKKIKEEGLETMESLRADNRRLRGERDKAISTLRYYGSSCAGCKWLKLLDGVSRVGRCTHEKGCDARHDFYEIQTEEEKK